MPEYRAPYSSFVTLALHPKPGWSVQSFEYYAAHYLVGSGLTGGDIDGNVRSLANALRKEYDLGVEHGAKAEVVERPTLSSSRKK